MTIKKSFEYLLYFLSLRNKKCEYSTSVLYPCVCMCTAASLPRRLMADYYNAWRVYTVVYVIYELALIGLGPAMLGQKLAPVGLRVFSTGGKISL